MLNKLSLFYISLRIFSRRCNNLIWYTIIQYMSVLKTHLKIKLSLSLLRMFSRDIICWVIEWQNGKKSKVILIAYHLEKILYKDFLRLNNDFIDGILYGERGQNYKQMFIIIKNHEKLWPKFVFHSIHLHIYNFINKNVIYSEEVYLKNEICYIGFFLIILSFIYPSLDWYIEFIDHMFHTSVLYIFC